MKLNQYTVKRPIRIEGKRAHVPLTMGYEAIIDAADADRIGKHSWTAMVKRGTVYVKRAYMRNGKSITVLLHREVMNVADDVLIDHRNGNGLDNTRANLRPATTSQNMCNRPAPSNNTSGFKGVCFSKASKKWTAQFVFRGKTIYVGVYPTPEDAYAARRKADAKLYGEFAWNTTHD